MIGHMAMTPTSITLYIVMLSTALSIRALIFCRLSLPIVFWSSKSTSSSRVALSNHHCALGRFFSLLFVCIECWISYLKRKGNSYTEGCSKLELTETSSGEIFLKIRTHASPYVGQDQVSWGVSALWDLPHSYDKSPYTNRNVEKAKREHKTPPKR